MLLYNLLTAEESVDGATTGGNQNPWFLIILLVALVGLFVYSYIRNKKDRQKQEKEAQERLNNLKVGDRVKTIGLICGIVVDVDRNENTFILETGKNNHGSFIKFDINAIYKVSHKDDEKKESEPEVKEAEGVEKTTETQEKTDK